MIKIDTLDNQPISKNIIEKAMASPSPFLFLKQRIQYWGQSNDSDPNILRVEITLRGLMSFIHVLATFELNERQYK